MILNRSVVVQSKVTTQDSEGLAINTYSTFKSNVKMGIMPNSLTDVQLKVFGAVDISANCKLAFIKVDSTIKELMRVVDGTDVYEIIAMNPYGFKTQHTELLLNPIQGVRND